jgi:hypothetical protein
MTLATLSIDLEARLAGLQQGFDKAARLAEKSASDVEARYNRLASVATGVGAALAGAFSSAALVQFFRATVNGLDALNDLADATGASIENLSALEDIAARTGTAFDTVGSALVRLNAQLTGAKQGSETAELLKRIGLNAEELRRLDPAEALRRTAVALSGFADDGNKARLVQELFGKSVREVAPLLKDLAEAGQLNATVTTEQARQAEKFNLQLAALSKNATDVARTFSGPVINALNQFFETQERAKNAGFSGFYDAAFSFNTFEIQRLDNLNVRLTEVIGKYVRVKEVVDAATAAGQRPPRELLNQLDQLEKQERFLRSLQKAQGGGREDGPRQPPGLPGVGNLPDPPGRPAAGNRARSGEFVGPPLDPVTEAALKRLESTDTAKLRQLGLELNALIRIGGDTNAGNQGEALRAIREEIAKLDPEQVKLAASRQRLNELLANTPTGQLQSVLSDIELLNAKYARSPQLVEQWAQAVRAVTARLPSETEKALEEISEFTRQFQRNIQNTLGDNIASVLRGDFDSIADAWKDMLLNMVAQATAADLATRLFGKNGQGGYVAELFGFLGFAKGGAFSNGSSITAFADGGVLNRPTFFGMSGNRMGVAGEAGPEAVLPLKRGSDGKLGVAGGGGGVTNVYNVAAGVTRGELVSALQLMSQQTYGRVMNDLSNRRVI